MPTYTSFLPTSSFLGPTSSSPARPSQVLAGSDPLVSPISTTATSIESTTIGPQEGQPSLVSSPVSNFVENFTLRWSQRSNRPPSQLKDYVCNTVRSGISPLISTSSPQSLDSGMCSYPLTHNVCNDKFSARHKAFLVVVTIDIEPSRFSETVPHLPWWEAMQSEMQALERNNTWELTLLPPGKKVLGCK